jgi:hypothetical protein
MMLRQALADIFGSLGMQAESRWQAAAEVRLLLTKVAATSDPIRSPALFAEPDARWLAGLNESGGTTYFNKEQFEELLTWLQLPRLIEIARAMAEVHTPKPAQYTALATVEKAVAHAIAAAETSGYRLDTFLASFSSVHTEVPTRP